MRKSTIYILLVIAALGFMLRAIDGGVDYFDDEPDWIVSVNSISLDDGFIHLPLAGSGHGPLSIYLTKLSGLLFGKTPFGYRMIIILLNTAFIGLMFYLTKTALGESAGLLAAALTAINNFFIYYSREIGPDGYFLFICAVVIYLFYKAAETNKNSFLWLFGIAMGIACLNDVAIVFLLPGFLFYLIVDKQRRQILKNVHLYLSGLAGLILLSPYVYWLYLHNWSHFKIGYGVGFFNFPILSFIFLGSVLNPEVPNINYFGRDYMALGMGVVLLLGIIFTLPKAKTNNFIFYMHCLFWGIFAISVTIFKGFPPNFNLGIIPAIILTSHFLSLFWEKHKAAKILIISFFIAQGLHTPFHLDKIRQTYKLYSLITIDSKNNPISVNLNDISRGLRPLIHQYNPTLVIIPDTQWDTAASYMEAWTGIRTLSPAPDVYDAVEFAPKNWNNILIIADNLESLSFFTDWAKETGSYNWEIQREPVSISAGKGQIPLLVDVFVLAAKNNTSLSKDSIKELRRMIKQKAKGI